MKCFILNFNRKYLPSKVNCQLKLDTEIKLEMGKISKEDYRIDFDDCSDHAILTLIISRFHI